LWAEDFSLCRGKREEEKLEPVWKGGDMKRKKK